MLRMFWAASRPRYRPPAMPCSRRAWSTPPSAAPWPLPFRTSHAGCGLTRPPERQGVRATPSMAQLAPGSVHVAPDGPHRPRLRRRSPPRPCEGPWLSQHQGSACSELSPPRRGRAAVRSPAGPRADPRRCRSCVRSAVRLWRGLQRRGPAAGCRGWPGRPTA